MAIATLTGLAHSVTFSESGVNGAAQIIDGDVVFGGRRGGSLVVSGLLPEDIISINDPGAGPGGLSVSGAELIFDGRSFGTFTGGIGEDLVIALNESSSLTAVDAVIENLACANISDTPTASRTLSIAFTDGLGAVLAPAIFEARTADANPFEAVDVGAESSPFLVDFDGDGDLDLVVGASNGSISYFSNTGSTTGPVFVEQTGHDNPVGQNRTGIGTAAKPGLADLDADGDLDFAVGVTDGGVRYFENSGTPSIPEFGRSTEVVSVASHAAPAAVDLDGDGDLDAVVGNGAGKLALFANIGTATEGLFSRMTGAENPFDAINIGDRATPSFGDIDGDGDLDLAVGAGDGTVKFFENTGTASAPAFIERTGMENPFDDIDVGSYAAPTLADLDGDGDLDAVIGGDGGTLVYFENTATRSIVVNVTPQNDAPVITSTGGGADAEVTIAENTKAVAIVTASDPDGTPSFSIAGGADADRFAIDAASGALSFKAAADFDAPADADGDNTYVVAVMAGDGAASDTQTIAVSVTNQIGKEIAGTDAGDTLTGSFEEDSIDGGKGNDKLFGDDGYDWLVGGKGNDKLTGGLGEDSFVFNMKLTDNVDTVKDFATGIDTIVLDDKIFKKLSPGPLAVEEFLVGKKAKDGDDHILYNAKNGQLLYDLDGRGGKDALLFGKIGKGLDLDASDFLAI